MKLDPGGMADGQSAGLVVFWEEFALLGPVQRDGVRRVQLRVNDAATDGPELPLAASALWLRAEISDQAICTFAYSLDGQAFVPIGGGFALGWHDYRGARVGLCCWNDDAEAGSVDVDSPYGGMVYDYVPVKTFAEKTWREGRFVPIPEHPPIDRECRRRA